MEPEEEDVFGDSENLFQVTKENIHKLCVVACAWGPPNQPPNASKFGKICSLS